MRRAFGIGLALTCALGLASCGSMGSEDRECARAVGSSTVYPFAAAVAEDLAKIYPDLDAAFVLSTGTSEGIRLFCEGVGLSTPDIINASRQMTKAEYQRCQANGVGEIIELQIGLDGIVFASARDGGISLQLTPQMIYEALAARPYGEGLPARTWASVDGSLPARPIEIYGPPPSSGTRDALKELVLKTGCLANGRLGGMKLAEPERFETVCTELRTDGAYVEQGEHDDMTVAKLPANPEALAIFGYSYFEENADKIKAMPVGGIEPTYDTIASGRYPAARPLYLYVKTAHLDMVPGLRPYLEQWAKSWGEDGPLTRIGLVAASERMQALNRRAIAELAPMNAAVLR
jgi:phosphate transport system substrate-binding protein